MPALSDHTRRDAQARAYSEISLALGQYRRRIWELAKANIESAIESGNGGEADGEQIGREAVAAALAVYVPAGEPQPAIDAAATDLGDEQAA